MISTYAVWKSVHILSAAVLFGTGIGIAFFAWFGYRRALDKRDIFGLRSVLRLTVIADSWFTAPAVLLQALSGFVLMHLNSWPLHSPWFVVVFSLFLLTGALWLPVVVIQIVLSREADRAAAIDHLSTRFHRLFIGWFALGIPAFCIVVVMFFLMVVKFLPVA